MDESEITQMRESFAATVAKYASANRSLQEQLDNERTRATSLENSWRQEEAKAQNLSNKLDEANRTIEELRSVKKRWDSFIASGDANGSLVAENATLQAENSSLQSERADLSAEVARLTSENASLQTLVASKIEISPIAETALSAQIRDLSNAMATGSDLIRAMSMQAADVSALARGASEAAAEANIKIGAAYSDALTKLHDTLNTTFKQLGADFGQAVGEVAGSVRLDVADFEARANALKDALDKSTDSFETMAGDARKAALDAIAADATVEQTAFTFSEGITRLNELSAIFEKFQALFDKQSLEIESVNTSLASLDTLAQVANKAIEATNARLDKTSDVQDKTRVANSVAGAVMALNGVAQTITSAVKGSGPLIVSGAPQSAPPQEKVRRKNEFTI
jgi:DNA repair exonuclease SbcCD ATPase subunit